MTPETLAALHALCFDAAPRPWSADEFAALLAAPATRLLTGPSAFALARAAGPEWELLTLAVAPEARRRGHARSLIARLEESARAEAAAEIFLEVAEANTPARALYSQAGYREAGLRKNYYQSPTGPSLTALVLKKALG